MRTDEHTLSVLEFPTVLDLVSSGAITAPGRDWIVSRRPLKTRDGAESVRNAVEDCMTLLREDKGMVLEQFEDLAGLFGRLRPEGAVLDGGELRKFLPLLRSAAGVSRSLSSRDDLYALKGMTGAIVDLPTLRRRLERSLRPDGTLADEASPELSRIRREMAETEERLERRLHALLRDPSLGPHLQDTYVTRRGDRCVIPVKRSEQSRIRGVLHDVSQSGETVFIEPLETLPLGNELMRLQAAERAETERILRSLSTEAREHIESLESNLRGLTLVDGLCTVAAFAYRESWNPCPFRADDTVRLRNCRHPLLEQRLRGAGDPGLPVPLSIDLESTISTLIISGANTGGKTVVLKTLGLLAALAASGFPVPADEGTEIPWFPYLGAVIGDEQSISHDLSTFSARMRRVVLMLRDTEPGGLVILDELGTGTDPIEGAALACAILQEFSERGTRSVVSTHLDIVKTFAHDRPGFLNAAVAFDPKTFRPTYELRLGEPGSSHAVEIGRREGLPDRVIQRAQEYAGSGSVSLEALIRDLNVVRERLAREQDMVAREREESARAREEAARQLEEQRRERREKVLQATREAKAIVADTRRRMEVALDDFRRVLKRSEKGAPAAVPRCGEGAVAKLRDAVAGEARNLDLREQDLAPEMETPLAPEAVSPGDWVFARRLAVDVQVESVDRRTGRGRVSAGGPSVEISLAELFPPRSRSNAVETRSTYQGGERARDIEEPCLHSRELVLVGQRVDPALSELERFLNDALLEGMGSVRIVHGLGTGTLGKAIRDHLRGHPGVSEVRPAGDSEGGEAVTLAELR